ncbi:hypothetical protein G7046_g4317 [Stylonectria norvegica]|nr:hypothetical protein G7046_g4317 [Stylonectria norvegica]
MPAGPGEHEVNSTSTELATDGTAAYIGVNVSPQPSSWSQAAGWLASLQAQGTRPEGYRLEDCASMSMMSGVLSLQCWLLLAVLLLMNTAEGELDRAPPPIILLGWQPAPSVTGRGLSPPPRSRESSGGRETGPSEEADCSQAQLWSFESRRRQPAPPSALAAVVFASLATRPDVTQARRWPSQETMGALQLHAAHGSKARGTRRDVPKRHGTYRRWLEGIDSHPWHEYYYACIGMGKRPSPLVFCPVMFNNISHTFNSLLLACKTEPKRRVSVSCFVPDWGRSLAWVSPVDAQPTTSTARSSLSPIEQSRWAGPDESSANPNVAD